jgi:hypothetical protein
VRAGIAPTLSSSRYWKEVNGQHHAPAALYPRGKSPQYPLYRRLGGPQSRSGRRGYKKSSASVGDRIPVVQSVVRHCTD